MNDKFTFEKEVYLDRFMLEYKDQAAEINDTITKLRTQVYYFTMIKSNCSIASRKGKESSKHCQLFKYR